jgi:hypothetical protein
MSKFKKLYEKITINTQTPEELEWRKTVDTDLLDILERATKNQDGTYDVKGNVNLNRKQYSKLPMRFRNVSGTFYCNDNNLTSLNGAPKNVGGDFSCRAPKNGHKFTKEDVRKICDVKGKIYV